MANNMPVVQASQASSAHDAATYEFPVCGKKVNLVGVLLLLIAFGGFGTWALLAKLSVSVVASGTVSVEFFKKTLQHLEGGIVSKIYVSNGDYVEKGEILIELDKTQEKSQLDIARVNWFIASAQEARLLAEQKDKDNFSFPGEIKALAQDNDRFREVLNVQRILFNSRRSSLKGRISALQAQIQQFKDQAKGLKETIIIYDKHVASLKDEEKDYKKLFKKGMVNNQRIRELQRKTFQLQSSRTQSKAQIAQLKSQISENILNIETQRQEYQREIGEQLRDALSIIFDSQEKIVALSDKVKRTHIKSPVSGTVVGLDIHTIGAVIQASKPIMSIVPKNDSFIVEARVPAQDIDNIYPGQHADIRFSAFNQRKASIIDGVVEHVSADSFEDESTGIQYYKARVKITDHGAENMTENMQLLSGMPAEVMIVTGEKTLFEYIVQPINEMLNRAMRES